jgi:hypothetical protein
MGDPKISLWTIQDGGGRHIGLCFNCYQLGTVQPIALKFGVGLQNDDAPSQVESIPLNHP